MSEPPVRTGNVRWISVAAFAIWGLLFAISYEYLPSLKYAWGFNLLRYHPDWAAWLLTGLALLFTTDEARRGAISASRKIASSVGALPGPARDLALFAVALALLWLGHERVLHGNSDLLRLIAVQDPVRLYPEGGGVWVFRLLNELAGVLPWRPVPTVQAVHCAAGALTVVFVQHAARLAVPEARGAGGISLLVFSAGLGAAIAGRFEVHAFALAASAAQLWLGLRYVRGESGIVPVAIAAGIAAWLQPLCLFALPAVFLLPSLCDRKFAPAAALSLLPLALWAAYLLAIDPKDMPPADVLSRLVFGAEGWVRGGSGGPSVGTDYVLFALPHLKYLVNAAFMLAPSAIPILLGVILHRRGAAFASAEARFLAVGTLGVLAGALVTRPAWGPFDWDLFGVTALWLAFFAGVLLTRLESGTVRNHLLAAAVGLQLCFVGVPLIAIGQGPSNDAGPFAPGHFHVGLYARGLPAPRPLQPWL